MDNEILWVVCLCAAWCRTCESYRTVFDAVALQYPLLRFVWMDIEEDAALVGDLDIETFPTLLIAHSDTVHFLGPLPPQEGILVRMLTNATGIQVQTPDAKALWQRIDAAYSFKPY